MTIRVPEEIIQQIIGFEVSSREEYKKLYLKPIYPGIQSGVTIGIGYDLGYVSKEKFIDDWKQHLQKQDLERLKKTIGMRGEGVKDICQELSDITISWQAAFQVFKKIIPKYQAMTKKAFPECEKLHPMAYGALVSLVFNRGSNIDETIDKRIQMANICKAFLGQIKYKGDIEDYIANEIRKMKRHWTLKGLHKRREREASIIESYKNSQKMLQISGQKQPQLVIL